MSQTHKNDAPEYARNQLVWPSSGAPARATLFRRGNSNARRNLRRRHASACKLHTVHRRRAMDVCCARPPSVGSQPQRTGACTCHRAATEPRLGGTRPLHMPLLHIARVALRFCDSPRSGWVRRCLLSQPPSVAARNGHRVQIEIASRVIGPRDRPYPD